MMSNVRTIDASSLAEKLQRGEVLLIDVREAAEFAECHIPNAISLPLTNIEPHFVQLSGETRTLVFQCQKGKRGELAAEQALVKVPGNKEIYNLTGGIEAWQQAALPVVSTQSGGKKTLPLNRQVFIAVGSLIFIGSLLAIAGIKAGAILTLFVSCGLLVAGFTGWCGMALLLQKMPWNR
ncbi:rhodanese-like domain-containing protein [Cardiobacteriaceae bacterium TAE3-ERU3]|nr:rhodanese-like domain-containing protein [Cardiobacteriaceae bacterium TAE3-ERU3]